MGKKRIILHIGTQKTGSSSFQASLKRNRHRLLERGIRPIREKANGPNVGGSAMRTNLVSFAHHLLRPELQTLARLEMSQLNTKDGYRKKRLSKLSKRISSLEDDVVLLSAEALCFLRTDMEQGLLAEFLADSNRIVTTVVVFREDAAWRQSWSDQVHYRLKKSGVTAPANLWSIGILGDWYFDRTAIQEFWNPFDLRLVNYEAHDNTVDPVYEAAGISVETLDTDIRRNVHAQKS